MKVLLLGEYSGLHNTLKEGLVSLGHDVTVVGDGDGFKNFPVDRSTRPTLFNKPILKWIKVGIFKLFNMDISKMEKGIRFWFHLKRLKGFDVVQLINEKPIKTFGSWERYFLKKIFKNNKKVFLLSCGIDSFSLQFFLQKKFKYSILDPYFKNPDLKGIYSYILNYNTESHRKTHELILKYVKGIIASDIDYVLPLEHHELFLGLVPNPINLDKFEYKPLEINSEIILFLGINSGNYNQKGIVFFEKALEVIQKKYKEKVKVIIAENTPYAKYVNLYNSAHIVLDQVYSYDQGYNALEAMAKGKVVFTGAETEFINHYKLKEDEVCINGLADEAYLVEKLSQLIEDPDRILEIGKNARRFIEAEHDYLDVTKQYLEKYSTD